MSSVSIRKIGITNLSTDAVVNAANSGLWEGGNRKEPELLYSAYQSSLKLARKNGLHSIGGNTKRGFS